MPANLVHVFRQNRNHVREDIQGVDLKVDQLGSEPLSDTWVALSCRRVQVKEQRFQELFLNHHLMRVNVERVTRDVEHLRPEHAFEF
jgi:hypothetical protein